MAPLALVVEESVHVNSHSQLILNGGDVGDLNWILDLMHVEGLEEMVVLPRSVCSVSNVGACRGDRIAEAPVVGVFDVDNSLLVQRELRELLEFAGVA